MSNQKRFLVDFFLASETSIVLDSSTDFAPASTPDTKRVQALVTAALSHFEIYVDTFREDMLATGLCYDPNKMKSPFLADGVTPRQQCVRFNIVNDQVMPAIDFDEVRSLNRDGFASIKALAKRRETMARAAASPNT